MIKKSLWNHACNKVAVSLILVVSMFVPFIIAPSVQAAEPISVSEAISNHSAYIHPPYIKTLIQMDLSSSYVAENPLGL